MIYLSVMSEWAIRNNVEWIIEVWISSITSIDIWMFQSLLTAIMLLNFTLKANWYLKTSWCLKPVLSATLVPLTKSAQSFQINPINAVSHICTCYCTPIDILNTYRGQVWKIVNICSHTVAYRTPKHWVLHFFGLSMFEWAKDTKITECLVDLDFFMKGSSRRYIASAKRRSILWLNVAFRYFLLVFPNAVIGIEVVTYSRINTLKIFGIHVSQLSVHQFHPHYRSGSKL